MRSFFVAGLALAVVSFAPTLPAQSCPFSGIQSDSFGSGAFFMMLDATWDASSCGLQFTLSSPVAAPFPGVQFHYLLVGAAPYPGGPLPLPEPTFLPGTSIDILPFDAFGPFPGDTSNVSVPANPSLIGLTFLFEGIPVYPSFTPGVFVVGDTRAVKLTLL